jgi:hypothetical protein
VSDDRTAGVLRLAYIEGLGIRAIARRLSMARKAVRKSGRARGGDMLSSPQPPKMAHFCMPAAAATHPPGS